jgi:hypothetical protein
VKASPISVRERAKSPASMKGAGGTWRKRIEWTRTSSKVR